MIEGDYIHVSKKYIFMTQYIQVSVSTPTEKMAVEIAKLVIIRRVAACAQVSGPIISFYNWKQSMEQSEEWKVTIKTSEERFKEVETSIRIVHSYDVPGIIATPLIRVSEDYADWMDEQLAS